jgi:hypothetical protein
MLTVSAIDARLLRNEAPIAVAIDYQLRCRASSFSMQFIIDYNVIHHQLRRNQSSVPL